MRSIFGAVAVLLLVLNTAGCRKASPEGSDAPVPMPVKENRDRVIPIIRPLGAVVQARQNIRPAKMDAEVWDASVPEEQLPICDFFVGDLMIRYAIDGEKAMTNVSPSMLGTLHIAREDLLSAGIKNLHRVYPGAEVQRADGFGMVIGSGDLESSWMLDFAFWAEEAKRFEGELIASVPSREIMVWGDSAKPELIETLRQKGVDIHDKEVATNRAISKLLYAWREGGWQVYEPPARER